MRVFCVAVEAARSPTSTRDDSDAAFASRSFHTRNARLAESGNKMRELEFARLGDYLSDSGSRGRMQPELCISFC